MEKSTKWAQLLCYMNIACYNWGIVVLSIFPFKSRQAINVKRIYWYLYWWLYIHSAQTYSAGKHPGCSAQEKPGVLPRQSSSNQSWLEDGWGALWGGLDVTSTGSRGNPWACSLLLQKKNCVRGKRTCKVYELPCTNLCKCTNCDNTLE